MKNLRIAALAVALALPFGVAKSAGHGHLEFGQWVDKGAYEQMAWNFCQESMVENLPKTYPKMNETGRCIMDLGIKPMSERCQTLIDEYNTAMDAHIKACMKDWHAD